MSVEDHTPAIAQGTWRKSSHSSGEGGECVEVAVGHDTVYVRDSKDRTGPVLTFHPQEWTAFLRFVTTD